ELIDGDGISVGEKQQLVTDSTGGFYCDILIPENAKEGQYHIKATASISEYTYWAYSTEFKVEANAMEIGSILIIGSILAAVTVLAAALVILLRKRT
ncbi:MAG: hypothetical protein MUE65_06340, partial [Methanomassiliicoccales archaeon]|nr:hypothetical protein [Methanomassiliicoccales archaeon]